MDIKGKIEEMIEKVTKDEEVKSLFAKDPVKAVEKVIGVDLPDKQINAIIDGVKAKLTGDKLKGAADKVMWLFGK